MPHSARGPARPQEELTRRDHGHQNLGLSHGLVCSPPSPSRCTCQDKQPPAAQPGPAPPAQGWAASSLPAPVVSPPFSQEPQSLSADRHLQTASRGGFTSCKSESPSRSRSRLQMLHARAHARTKPSNTPTQGILALAPLTEGGTAAPSPAQRMRHWKRGRHTADTALPPSARSLPGWERRRDQGTCRSPVLVFTSGGNPPCPNRAMRSAAQHGHPELPGPQPGDAAGAALTRGKEHACTRGHPHTPGHTHTPGRGRAAVGGRCGSKEDRVCLTQEIKTRPEQKQFNTGLYWGAWLAQLSVQCLILAQVMISGL